MGSLTLGARCIAERNAYPVPPGGQTRGIPVGLIGRWRWHADRGAPEGFVREAFNVCHIRAKRQPSYPLPPARTMNIIIIDHRIGEPARLPWRGIPFFGSSAATR
jgi:hypothetical protein